MTIDKDRQHRSVEDNYNRDTVTMQNYRSNIECVNYLGGLKALKWTGHMEQSIIFKSRVTKSYNTTQEFSLYSI